MISYRHADLLDQLNSRPFKQGDRVRVHRDKIKLHDNWRQDMINRKDYLDNIGTLGPIDEHSSNPLIKVQWDRLLEHPNDADTNASYWHLEDLERA